MRSFINSKMNYVETLLQMSFINAYNAEQIRLKNIERKARDIERLRRILDDCDKYWLNETEPGFLENIEIDFNWVSSTEASPQSFNIKALCCL